MNHTEFIMQINNIVPQNFINKIIPLIDEKAKHDLGVGMGFNKSGIDKNRRDVKGYCLGDNMRFILITIAIHLDT